MALANDLGVLRRDLEFLLRNMHRPWMIYSVMGIFGWLSTPFVSVNTPPVIDLQRTLGWAGVCALLGATYGLLASFTEDRETWKDAVSKILIGVVMGALFPLLYYATEAVPFLKWLSLYLD